MKQKVDKLLVGYRLYSLRINAGYSRKFVAQQLGVSTCALWTWENGKRLPRADYLVALAAFYGVSIDYILTRRIKGSYDWAHKLSSEELLDIINNDDSLGYGIRFNHSGKPIATVFEVEETPEGGLKAHVKT